MKNENLLNLEQKFTELLKGPKNTKIKSSKNNRITASELQAHLQKNEEYQKWLQEIDSVRQALENALQMETKELLYDLERAGFKINSIYDLVNTSQKYEQAIPILIQHLSRPYHSKNKEGIIRALAVKEAIGKATSVLIEEYNRIPKEEASLRWTIGNTIYTIITKDDIEKILPIVNDKKNGLSRQMFVAALGKVKSEKSENALILLLDDDEVTLQALKALGRLKSKKAEEKIIAFTNHPKDLIRKEAQKALKKIL